MTSTNLAQNWKYQGQERTEDLGLNVDEWKYRMSDPAIGRFLQVDPMATFFPYNGTYNFAENRVIDGNELEGMQWTRYRNPDGSTHYVVHFKVLNSTTDVFKGIGGNVGRLTVEQTKTIASGVAKATESAFSGVDSNGNYVTVTASYELVDVIDPQNDYYLELVDNVMADDGSGRTLAKASGLLATGKVRNVGNSQINRIQIAQAPWTTSNQERIETGAHELGHTTGLTHDSGDGSPFNLMSSGEIRLSGKMDITPEQRTTMKENIPVVTPVPVSPRPVIPIPIPLPSSGSLSPVPIPNPPAPAIIIPPKKID